MEKMIVRDLMVTTDRFPKISDQATFYEGLLTLESAQENFLSGKSEQRILLVENDKGKIISKISPVDLIRGLETNYNRINSEATVKRFGLHHVWEAMKKDYNLWENPFRDLCKKAGDVRIKQFIKAPDDGQCVGPEDPLSKCFHLFVMHRHDSLFVIEGKDIIGLLRFSDVFKEVSKNIKLCI